MGFKRLLRLCGDPGIESARMGTNHVLLEIPKESQHALFGLAFATLLVLIVIPALLNVHESVAHWWNRDAVAPLADAAE